MSQRLLFCVGFFLQSQNATQMTLCGIKKKTSTIFLFIFEHYFIEEIVAIFMKTAFGYNFCLIRIKFSVCISFIMVFLCVSFLQMKLLNERTIN